MPDINVKKNNLTSLLVSSSLQYPLVVFSIAIFIFTYGAYSLGSGNYDIFPNFAPPSVQIQTESPGMSPHQVEELVTEPLEMLLVGMQGVKEVKSNSIQGLSVISVLFDGDTDIYLDRQLVAERLSEAASSLPKGIVPLMAPLTSTAGVILTIGITSDKLSLMDLRTIADWELRPRLLAVPGVASVVIVGGDVKQIQVQVDPDALVRENLSIQDVAEKTALSSGIKGAGFIDSFNQRVNIRSKGQITTPEELAQALLVYKEGKWIPFGQIGSVKNAPAPSIGASQIEGKPGVILQITSQYNENTLTVTHNLLKALQDIEPSLKKRNVELFNYLFRPADFIKVAFNNVEIALLAGIFLVMLILFLFLLNWKSVFIAMVAIPLSLMAALICLHSSHYSLNIMSLGGLAIAIGLLVDDAVITVENIFRRLRENKKLTSPLSSSKTVLNAALEVRGAVVYATLTIMLVFIPVIGMPGVAGKLFTPLAAAYILATFASLVVALTVTPSLAYLLSSTQVKEPQTIKWLKDHYQRLLILAEKWIVPIISLTVLLIICGFFFVFHFKKTYLPPMEENYYILHVNFTPGTSLSESIRIGKEITHTLLKNPNVKSVAQRAGRGKLGADIHGTHQSEMDILIETNDISKVTTQIREAISQFPGVYFLLNSFLTERINETLSGYTADFIIELFGPNLDELDDYSGQIANELATIPGAVDILLQSQSGTPEMTVELNQNSLIRWGFNALDILDTISTVFQGKRVGEFYIDNQIFDFTVILDPKKRNQPETLKTLLIKNPSQNYVSLDQLADIFPSSGRYNIQHNGGRRVAVITCNIAGVDIIDFEKEVKSRIISKINLPSSIYVEVHGVAEAQKKAQDLLIFSSTIVGLAIILILYLILKSAPYILLLLCNLPFAFLGGVLAVYLSGGVFSIGSMVGFIAVFGITLRNSIMIVLHAQHLIMNEGKAWSRETAVLAAQERLTPILITAFATGFGLLPIAYQSGQAGSEIEGPVAIVIVGGLCTSTLLNLVILPILMMRFPKFFTPTSKS